MKTQIFLLVAFCIMNSAKGQSFNSISLQSMRNNQAVAFTIARETNVRHYRIEASNDGVEYKVIGTVPSKGNSVMPVHYQFNISVYPYTYYRVGIVAMNGQMPYSEVVTKNSNRKEIPTHEGAKGKNEPVLVTK